MRAPRKLAAYAAVLAAVFAASLAAGAVAEPTGLSNAEPAEEHDGMPEGMALPGLATADDGLRLIAESDTSLVGVEVPYRFRIVGDDGRQVTAFDVEHTKRMHLIVVRRDFAGFQHLHPEMAADGTWEIPLTVNAAGSYRVFADFVIDEEKHTLGADLFVSGDYRHQPLPEHAHVADAGDGYTVELEGEALTGAGSEL
jgi:hypothetical protein